MTVSAFPKPAPRTDDLVTEDAAAQRFRDKFGDNLRFCHDTGGWFTFDGARWRHNRTGVAFEWARQLARELVEREPDRVRFVSSKTSFAAGVERFARSDPAFAVTSEFWDPDPLLLGTPAGPVDLRTGHLIPPSPDDGISKSTSCSASIVADCPLWLRFLHETTGGDADLVRFLKLFAGYACTGDVREHALVFGYGPGGNGKSVFVNTIAGILGDYSTVAPMETFAASGFDRHPTELAALRGARLVAASETEEGRAWAESRIKQITGGDTISARFMRKDFFSFKPAFKLLIVGNHRPQLRNVDDAARRRFIIVPFTRKPDRPDRELETKLRKEWPAILRWMIEGCLEWQANGLIRPKSVTDATDQYFGAQDILGQFLEDECDYEPGNPHKTAVTGEMFSAWTTYAKAAGETSGSAKSFTEALERRGIERGRTGRRGRFYRGIRLKLPTDDQTRYGNIRGDR